MRRWGFTGPIVGVTGDDDLGPFLEAGATDALTKPIKAASLQGIMRIHAAVTRCARAL